MSLDTDVRAWAVDGDETFVFHCNPPQPVSPDCVDPAYCTLHDTRIDTGAESSPSTSRRAR